MLVAYVRTPVNSRKIPHLLFFGRSFYFYFNCFASRFFFFFREDGRQPQRQQQQQQQHCVRLQDRLGEEAARSINYLAAGTEPKLKHIVETELIRNHAKVLVEMENSGCTSMFRDDKVGSDTVAGLLGGRDTQRVAHRSLERRQVALDTTTPLPLEHF